MLSHQPLDLPKLGFELLVFGSGHRNNPFEIHDFLGTHLNLHLGCHDGVLQS